MCPNEVCWWYQTEWEVDTLKERDTLQEDWIGWNSGLTRTLWSYTRTGLSEEQLCGKGPCGQQPQLWVNGVLLWQRMPTECWPATTHASPAGMKKSLSCPTQCFSGHTWNTAFTFGPCYTKNMWTDCRGSREGPQKRKCWDKCLFSLEIRRFRGDLTTVSQYLKDGYKEDGDCLFTGSHREKGRGNGYTLFLGTFQLDTRGNISQWEQSAIGIIPPGKWWILQHQTHLRFSWAGCWIILSRPCFCQERLDQMIPWGLFQPVIL